MTVFLAALAGIPPAGGWFAKFGLFRALLDAGGIWAAMAGGRQHSHPFAYYALVCSNVVQPIPDGDNRPIAVTGSLGAACGDNRSNHGFRSIARVRALWRGIGAVGLSGQGTKLNLTNGRLP